MDSSKKHRNVVKDMESNDRYEKIKSFKTFTQETTPQHKTKEIKSIGYRKCNVAILYVQLLYNPTVIYAPDK